MGDHDEKDEWLKRVLGVSLDLRRPPGHPGRQLRFAPVPAGFTRPRGRTIVLPQGPSGTRPITVPTPPRSSEFQGVDQGRERKVRVRRSADGRVVYTAPSPPVGEITFSGGGGKGAALPGAVKALHDSGVLRGVRQVAGASVGSMTAALVAAGISGAEFAEIANAQETTDRIVEGSGGTKLGLLGAAIRNTFTAGFGNPLTGQGLEDVVCDALNLTLVRRIGDLQQQCGAAGKPLPPAVAGMLPRLEKAPGPTFMDLRLLSQHIPAVKEVVITGTYTTERDVTDGSRMMDGNQSGLLYVFSADNEPDMPIALAVHASASFPKAFKPVDLKLSSGLTVRFIDGGVMNNTPTATSLGNRRALDGMPQERGMAFVFEDDEDDESRNAGRNLLKGKVTPAVGLMARLMDAAVGASHLGSEYAKDRDMADRPEDIVVVPLRLSRPKTSKKGTKKIDMRGGTLEFNLSDKDKAALQNATEQATLAQIRREEGRERSREFASDRQMFVSIPLKDLELLAAGGYAGAAGALDFRKSVAEQVELLERALAQARSEELAAFLLDRVEVVQALDALDRAAGDDVDFQGHVGRELNRGPLDTLVDAMRRQARGGRVLDATAAVSVSLTVRSGADHLLKNVIYPQMKNQGSPQGAGMQTIRVMEALLRVARTPDEVNQALRLGIEHFRNKPDRLLPRRGHKAFAQTLQHMLMR